MKRKEFLDNLSVAKICLSTQDTIPALTHFYTAKNTIMSYNAVSAVIINFEHDLSCCIPGEEILKILGSYDTEVKLSHTDSTLSVKSGRSSVKLKILPVGDWPFKLKDDILNNNTVYDLNEDFFEGIKACAVSMGANSSKREQYGITVISTKEKTVLYSSDQARISSFTLSKPIQSDPFSFLLPKPFCDSLISICKDFKEGRLHIGADSILIDFLVDGKSAGIQLFSNFNNNIELLPFERIFSQVILKEDRFQEIPASLLSCIDRHLILISSDKNPEIEIKTNGKLMTLTSGNAFGGTADEVDFLNDLGEIVCKMKPLFVRQVIADSDKISFSDFEGDIVLVGVKSNFVHLVSSIEE